MKKLNTGIIALAISTSSKIKELEQKIKDAEDCNYDEDEIDAFIDEVYPPYSIGAGRNKITWDASTIIKNLDKILYDDIASQMFDFDEAKEQLEEANNELRNLLDSRTSFLTEIYFIPESKFDEMLEVLPPEGFFRRSQYRGFYVPEAVCHRKGKPFFDWFVAYDESVWLQFQAPGDLSEVKVILEVQNALAL